MVVKIKYRGIWRKVVGITYNNGLGYYMAQADDKIGYQPVRIGNPEITAVVEEMRSHYPSAKKKLKDIDHTTKKLIYYDYTGGAYYQKEILSRYNITQTTLYKIINEIKGEMNGNISR